MPAVGNVGLAYGRDIFRLAVKHPKAVHVTPVFTASSEMKLGFQIGRKLCTGSTVARQEWLVFTKTGRPSASAASRGRRCRR